MTANHLAALLYESWVLVSQVVVLEVAIPGHNAQLGLVCGSVCVCVYVCICVC